MSILGKVGAAALVVLGVVSPVRAGEGEHCSYRLVPVRSDGPVITAELELIGCFGTFEQAIEEGSGGAIDLTASETPATVTDTDLLTAAAVGTVLIGTEFDGSGYVGASNDYFASSTCSALTTWQVSYVSDAWNDRFQSGKGFGGCDTNRKFEHSNFGGTLRTCTPNCTDYGLLSNRVSSLRWRA
jgi:hypothetical protein